MKTKTSYEWDIETSNSDGDIEDHRHADKLSELARYAKLNQCTLATLPPEEKLVLVRDEEREVRSWAYVENGKLPEFFTDAYDRPTAKVPKRFHAELARHINA